MSGLYAARRGASGFKANRKLALEKAGEAVRWLGKDGINVSNRDLLATRGIVPSEQAVAAYALSIKRQLNPPKYSIQSFDIGTSLNGISGLPIIYSLINLAAGGGFINEALGKNCDPTAVTVTISVRTPNTNSLNGLTSIVRLWLFQWLQDCAVGGTPQLLVTPTPAELLHTTSTATVAQQTAEMLLSFWNISNRPSIKPIGKFFTHLNSLNGAGAANVDDVMMIELTAKLDKWDSNIYWDSNPQQPTKGVIALMIQDGRDPAATTSITGRIGSKVTFYQY